MRVIFGSSLLTVDKLMFSIRSTEVKLAGNDVTHGDQVVYGSVSSGLGFSCLNQAVDPFKDTIVHPAVEPIQDAVPVRLDSFSGLGDRLQLAVARPPVPFLQIDLGGIDIGLFEQSLKG